MPVPGKKSHRCSLAASIAALGAAVSIVTLSGCFKDAGVGGTGEIVIPAEKLRQIDQVRMDALPASRPSTLPTTVPAEVSLSIEECRQAALANNLDLRVELLNPTLAKEAVTQEQAAFESIFTSNLAYSTTDAPTATQLTGSKTKDLRADVGLQVPLKTGGSVQVTLPVDRFETNNSFSTLNPAYTSNLSASLSIPLLRGAGLYRNTQSIRVAFYQYQESQTRTKLEVIRVLADTDRVYWRLYAARQELRVRQKEYDLAMAQLERARRQHRAGTAAEVEILRAESGVADTQGSIIVAENAVRQRQRDLKRILNRDDLDMGLPTAIIPKTLPDAGGYKLDPQRLAEVAVRQRMEMLELELRIAEQSSNIDAARNDTLPLLAFNYTYNVPGLGGSLDSSFRMLLRKKAEDHSVGLQLQVPIGNEAARSRLRSALLTRIQTLATRDQRIAQIRQEVFDALDQLDANWQRILASQKRVILAQRVAEAEARQFEQGLRTSTDVLDAQTKLADAQSAEISALTDYQISQVDIAFATGTVLGASHVIWTPAALPANPH